MGGDGGGGGGGGGGLVCDHLHHHHMQDKEGKWGRGEVRGVRVKGAKGRSGLKDKL